MASLKADKGIMDALVHLRKKKGAGGGGGKQLQESQFSRRGFGACFMLTMPGSSRITRAAEEEDEGDRGRVRGVWPDRIGGQD